MTVSVTTASVSYTGDGSTVSFPTVFVFGTSADVEVIERTIATGAEVTKTLTTDYVVSGGGGAGAAPATGTVTANSAPASTVSWTIRRAIGETQEIALPAAGALPSSAVEAIGDRNTMMAQQHSEEIGRSLAFPKTDSSTLNPTIPNSVDRASKLLAFTADGTPTVRELSDGGTGTMSNLVEDETPQLGGVLDTNGNAINESEGSAVASVAGETDIWATDGNTVHVTGTNTITSFAAAPRVGARRTIIADGAFTLTHSANLNCPGSANITLAVGDTFDVYADTLTQHDIQNFHRADGKPLVGGPTASATVPGVVELATAAEVATGTDTARVITPATQFSHISAAKAFGHVTGGGTPVLAAAPASDNITSISDDGTGILGVTIADDMSGTAYTLVASGGHTAIARNVQEDTDLRTAGSFTLLSDNAGGAATDLTTWNFVLFGGLA